MNSFTQIRRQKSVSISPQLIFWHFVTLRGDRWLHTFTSSVQVQELTVGRAIHRFAKTIEYLVGMAKWIICIHTRQSSTKNDSRLHQAQDISLPKIATLESFLCFSFHRTALSSVHRVATFFCELGFRAFDELTIPLWCGIMIPKRSVAMMR